MCSIISHVDGESRECESGGTGRRARLRGVWFTPYGFKSRFSHQTVEIRTLYQSVKGSDFYYILTILILIKKYKNTKREKENLKVKFLFSF